MNATDGLAHPSGSPPLQGQRPPSSSSNESGLIVSKVDKRRNNLGKSGKSLGLLGKQKSVGPQYQANLIDDKLPRQHTLAPGNNRRQANLAKHDVKKQGWANNDDANDSELL